MNECSYLKINVPATKRGSLTQVTGVEAESTLLTTSMKVAKTIDILLPLSVIKLFVYKSQCR